MKKIGGAIVALVVIAAACVGGYFGYQYYQDHYVGTETWAKITYTPEKQMQISDSGERITDSTTGAQIYEYEYEVTGYTADGHERTMTFRIDGVDPKPLEVGSYVECMASDARVVSGPKTVSESDVPASVLQKLG
ncbi:MAG: YxeA family protein [Propionibacteriaceae bacterium]|jgi:uncharacterized protein (TIGR01655 family)|nr:YxeA family protein [Propionibacteriaceae bacterium]